MADEYSPALLQLPHHGWAGDNLCGGDGGCGLSVVAKETLHLALDVMDSSALSSLSLHRKHGRLDDGGTRPPAMAGLQHPAHDRRLFQIRVHRKWMVYPAGIYGPLFPAGHFVFVSDAPR